MRRAMCELMYPKPQKKKKRKHHPAPIVETYPGICYLCAKEEGNWNYQYTECHHVVFGGGGRTRSEENGLKVYLCRRHHKEEKTLYIIAVQPVKGYAHIYRKHTNRITHERSG